MVADSPEDAHLPRAAAMGLREQDGLDLCYTDVGMSSPDLLPHFETAIAQRR